MSRKTAVQGALILILAWVIGGHTVSAEETRYIVRFKAARVMSAHVGLSVMSTELAGVQPITAHPLDNSVTVRLTEAQASSLAARPDIDSIEVDHKIKAFFVPNDTNYEEMFALNGTHGIKAPEAWDVTRGSTNKLVAIIDSGVDYTHEDLQDNAWVNPGEIPDNDVDDDGNGYTDDYHGFDFASDSGNGGSDSDPMDENGHGTHVAGIVAATGDNALGTVGVAWQTNFIPVKCLDADGGGAISYLVSALDYVAALKDQGFPIAVVNMSLGTDVNSAALARAAERVTARGIILVAAAGNEAVDNDEIPSYPANIDLPNIISVAATTSAGTLADFSNFGATSVDIGAPGSFILSTRPPGLPEFLGSSYGYDSGTSMATPHVSGVVALIAAANPNATASLIKGLLLATVSPQSALSGSSVTGGIVNADNAVQMAVASQVVHKVTGVIKRSGRGLARVKVTLRHTSGATYRRSTTTSATGAYTFSSVPQGNYIITATRSRYRFLPRSVRLAVTTRRRANFTAQ